MPINKIKIVSKNFDIPNSHKLKVAKTNGRYSSIDRTFDMSQEGIIDEIGKSGLRGKGGGGALAGDKWKLLSRDGTPSYLVVNADESEPGTFKDRQIMEYDPHLLIEGIIDTCYAIGANDAYIYIRGEYVFWAKRLNEAIDEAYEDGILGDDACGKGYRVDVTVHRGGGAYICGEKSALLESLEGKRGHPRLKPKQKEPEWFFGKPTLVNNVETIASVPYILENGYEAYRSFGTPQSPGTMLFGMSGHINKPGIYEAEFGVSMMEYIEEFGGGIKDGKKLKAVIPGGSSCRILTADECRSARLDYESMKSIGTSLGTGGMIVMDESVNIPEATKNLIEFYHHESCGQCTPCREGCGWVDKLLFKILNKEATSSDIDLILKIADLMNGKTVCVFAPAAADVIISHIHKFRDEFEAYIKS
jgi:NADH-quinone oxidoreductase subunit F